MTIIIRIRPNVIGIFWALIALLGVLIVQSGFFYALNGLTNFDNITLANSEALSHISGGIVVFVLGLVVIALGYLGVRGKIIITTSETQNRTLLRPK